MNLDSTRQDCLPWNFLAPREKQFLELIYQVDVEARRLKRQLPLTQKKPSTKRQCWLFYGDTATGNPSRLKQMLLRASLADRKTYSTFEHLEQNGLIECSDCVSGVNIRLTGRGYEIVGVDAEAVAESVAFGEDELSESAWFVLACVCAVPTHFVSTTTGAVATGKAKTKLSCKHVSQETLWSLTMLTYPLVEQYEAVEQYEGGWIRATEFGQIFYVDQYAYYRVRYRAIAAPPPSYSKADVIQRLKRQQDLPKLARIRRDKSSLTEAVAAIKAEGITPALLYRLEQRQLEIPQALSPSQIKAVYRWIEEAC